MNFNPSAFMENLKYMGIGMLSIGIVIGIIILVTLLLNAATKPKTNNIPKKYRPYGRYFYTCLISPLAA